MTSKFISAIEKYNLINKNDKVIVALSGGADSVCLLYNLVSIGKQYNLKIYAAHVNHLIRGDEAFRDMKFCEKTCDRLNVQLFTKTVDVKKLAKEKKQSEELCGRNVRYAFFEELSQKYNAKVATAHTASDNLETVIYNIARGSSINGLKGIVPKRENIIRPLIFFTRCDVEKYCDENSLEFVNDSTNNGDDYTRNRIRHNVVPILKAVNTTVENSVSCLSDDMQKLNAFMDKIVNSSVKELLTDKGFDCQKLLSLDEIVLNRFIYNLICKANVQADRKLIELCKEAILNGGVVELSKNTFAISKQGFFRIKEKVSKNYFEPVRLVENMNFVYNNKQYAFSIVKFSNIKKNDCYLDANFLNNEIFIRTRKQGDLFTLPKRKVTKTVKKLLNEKKIPAEDRDSLLCIALNNQVLWLEGIGVSQIEKNSIIPEMVIKIEINDGVVKNA